MIPTMKNITSNNIEKIDTNNDGQITPQEIKQFWSVNEEFNIKPDASIIQNYIIEPAFQNDIMKISKVQFVSSLGEPTQNGTYTLVNVTQNNQGMTNYVLVYKFFDKFNVTCYNI